MSRLNDLASSVILAALTPFSLMGAATLTVVGDCRFSLDPSHLQSAAGSDFQPYIESSPGTYRIFVQTSAEQDRWRLNISSQIQVLPQTAALMVRVSTPTINGNISSSWLEWQQLGNQSIPLVEGEGQAGAIEIQLRLVDLKLKDLTRSQYAPRVTFEVEDL